jgi:hypothetical protein
LRRAGRPQFRSSNLIRKAKSRAGLKLISHFPIGKQQNQEMLSSDLI